MTMRCYHCGRFIGYEEMENGKAKVDYPDFERMIVLEPPDPVPMHVECATKIASREING